MQSDRFVRPSRFAEAADDEDQLGADQAELPLPPERAELLLAGRRGAIAVAGRRLARVAACDRGAVEGRVEGLFVQVEPATKCPAGAAAPQESLLALEGTGRLAVDVGPLACVGLDDEERLQWIAGLDARGRRGCRAGATRSIGTTSAVGSRSGDHHEVAVRVQDATAELLREVIRCENALVDLPAGAVAQLPLLQRSASRLRRGCSPRRRAPARRGGLPRGSGAGRPLPGGSRSSS